VRIALIGLGHVAAFQLAALTRDSRWQVVGAADRQSGRASLLPDNIPFYPDASTLLAECDAEVCVVATGHAEHYLLARAVLKSGRHVLIEKPCCTTLAQFMDLVALARDRQRHLHIALHAAFALELQWLLAQRQELGLGKITAFQCCFLDPYIAQGHLLPAAAALGGSWIDSGINALSVLATLFPPEQLRVGTADFSHLPGADCDDTGARVCFAGPTEGCIETGWERGINSKSTRLVFDGGAAEVLLDHSREEVILCRHGISQPPVVLRNGRPRLENHYTGVFDDAHQAFSHGHTNVERAMKLHGLLHAAIALKYPRANAC